VRDGGATPESLCPQAVLTVGWAWSTS
jgi:hypothetical protein